MVFILKKNFILESFKNDLLKGHLSYLNLEILKMILILILRNIFSEFRKTLKLFYKVELETIHSFGSI